MANAYFYSSTAVQTQLVGGISGGSTVAQVASTVGWPSSYPYVVSIDYGGAAEELVVVTNNSAGVLTIARGFDSTSAQTHSIGAVVRHVYCANDATAFRTHEAATSAVHGVASTIVGTTDTQTLTNKTLNSPTITSGALSGTFTGAPTFSGALVLSGTPSISSGAALAGTFTGTPTFSGAVVFSGGPNFSAGATIAGGTLSGTFTGTPTFSGAAAFSGSPTFTGNPGISIPIAAAANVGITIKGAASQSGNFLEWRDNSSNLLGALASDGHLLLSPVATAATPLVVNAPSGLSGNLATLSINSVNKFVLNSAGNISTIGTITQLTTSFAEDTTASTTTSTTYAASSTALSTTIVVGPSGKIEVGFWVRASNSGAASSSSSYNLSGTSSGTIFTASDAQSSVNSGTASIGPFYTGHVYTGLVAGETVTMTAQHKVSANTGTFSTRQMVMRTLPS